VEDGDAELGVPAVKLGYPLVHHGRGGDDEHGAQACQSATSKKPQDARKEGTQNRDKGTQDKAISRKGEK
jgi:hypothetical protein